MRHACVCTLGSLATHVLYYVHASHDPHDYTSTVSVDSHEECVATKLFCLSVALSLAVLVFDCAPAAPDALAIATARAVDVVLENMKPENANG